VHPAWLSALRDHFLNEECAGEQTGALGRAQPPVQRPQVTPVFEMEFDEGWAPEYSIHLPGLDQKGTPKGCSAADSTRMARAGAGQIEVAEGGAQGSSSRGGTEQVDADAATVIELLPTRWVISLHTCTTCF